jgi:hypothetical protein
MTARSNRFARHPRACRQTERKPRAEPSIKSSSSTKSAPAKMPSAHARVASVTCAPGSKRRSSLSAGTVITASPTQFAPRTTTRSITSG